MSNWLKTAAASHKAMPILCFPGIQLTGMSVQELVLDGGKQAACMKALAERYDVLASVSLMDLSVEAEAFGSPVRFSDDEVPTVTGALISNLENMASLRIPEIGAARTGEYISSAREAVKTITNTPVLAGTIGPFSLAGRMMDMTEIMLLCYDEPELVHSVLEKATLFLIDYNTQFREAGVNGILMAEPAAGLLSPALIEEFSTPYVRRILRAVETENCKYIYHNCGNTIPLAGSIIKTGASALHFGNAVNMAKILPLIPHDRIVFGNIDPVGQFRNGTPESVRVATLDLLNRCAQYPNFVISSGCDIPPASPIANIDAFFEAVADFWTSAAVA